MQTNTAEKKEESKPCPLTEDHLALQSFDNPMYVKLIKAAAKFTKVSDIVKALGLNDLSFKEIEKSYGLKERSDVITLGYGRTRMTVTELAKRFNISYIALLARYETIGSNVGALLTEFGIEVWSYHSRWYDKKDLEKESGCKFADIMSDKPSKKAAAVRSLLDRQYSLAHGSDSSV